MENNLDVLIVDDNVDAADMLYYLLSAHGYTVIRSYRPEEALELAKRHRPWVAILDLQMPEMDGVTLGKAIHEAGHGGGHTHLIALSGNTEEKWRARTAAAGFVAHLRKPADWPSLETLLISLLNTQKVS